MKFTIINQTKDGVLLQMDNGDTQYLTSEEYVLFLKNREKNGY
jgi:hypothetical protein